MIIIQPPAIHNIPRLGQVQEQLAVQALIPENRPSRIVATGGGARSELWLKIKADLLGAEFVTTNCPEPACKGAAMIAAVAASWFDDLEQAADAWVSLLQTVEPDAAGREAYAKWYGPYLKAVSRG